MIHPDTLVMLEYPAITQRLENLARTEGGRARARNLTPLSNPAEIVLRTAQTQSARSIYDALGSPPIHSMEGMSEIGHKFALGDVLAIDELRGIERFLHHCALLKRYLARAAATDKLIAAYGASIDPLADLKEELSRVIRGDGLDDHASSALRSIRAKMASTQEKIKEKLGSLLRAHPAWFQEGYFAQRGGRYVLPVRREYRAQVRGAARDASGSGATVFIEPESVAKLHDALEVLDVEESNEVLRILSELSARAASHAREISINSQAMEDIDFAFACGRLGSEMNGVCAQPTRRRQLILAGARHPLLPPGAVPLSVSLGDPRALVITGPNTGGKTVALKTMGLLSLLAMSGLLVPAKEATVPVFSGIWADIGDGQSIAQSLSTFSSHVTRLVHILKEADGKSLVLLDELGSGTDPQEGMGLAAAVLTELGARRCLIAATSHYPDIKTFAQRTPGFVNGRMTFDRRTLSPEYRLEMGAAGESCALYIAKRLGVPESILKRAWQTAYPEGNVEVFAQDMADPPAPASHGAPCADIPEDMPGAPDKARKDPPRGAQFQRGDRVFVTSMGQYGTVSVPRNSRGEVGVRVRDKNFVIPEKRLKPFLSGEDLYPGGVEGYDLDIVLTSVADRFAKRDLRKGKAGAQRVVREGKEEI